MISQHGELERTVLNAYGLFGFCWFFGVFFFGGGVLWVESRDRFAFPKSIESCVQKVKLAWRSSVTGCCVEGQCSVQYTGVIGQADRGGGGSRTAQRKVQLAWRVLCGGSV